MIQLHYYLHLLLISRYRLFIQLAIILLIYLAFYGDKFIYCMNESTDIIEAPTRPVKRHVNHQVAALMEEAKDYAGSQASLLDELARTKAELAQTKTALSETKDRLFERNERVRYLKSKIHDLRELRDMYKTEAVDSKFYLDRSSKKVETYCERFGPLEETEAKWAIPPSARNHELFGIPSDSEWYDSDVAGSESES